MKNCVITGATGLLASHIATLHNSGSADAAWYFVDHIGPSISLRLEELLRLGAAEINVVCTPFAGGGASRWLTPRDGSAGPFPRRSGLRFFQTTMIAGQADTGIAGNREGVLHFLATLYDFKQEIEERLPDYFRQQPLRCLAPPAASINIVAAKDAAEMIVRLARQNPADGTVFHIGGSFETPLCDFYERAGAAYGIDLKPVTDVGSMNSVDRLFERRLCGFHQLPDAATADRVVSLDGVDGTAQQILFDGVRRQQDDVRAARDTRVAAMPDSLKRETIGALTYHVAGNGDRTIVVLNALGQGLPYWYRLIDYLVAREYRLVIWQARGPRLNDQVDDLTTIFAAENIKQCSLVGWCTGAKAGIELCKRHPEAVRSMVLLNCTLKRRGANPKLDTEYERNFETFCNMVTAHPEMAGAVCDALIAVVAEKDPVMGGGAEQFSRQVLAMSNRHLRGEVLAPFRTAAGLLEYCRQVLDFWSHDVAGDARTIDAPVLVIASELDRVVSTAGSEYAAGLFRRTTYRPIPGATHYCLYDRPDVIGELIDAFVGGTVEIA